MRNFLLAAGLLFAAAAPAQAALITGWNFNDAANSTNSAANTAALFSSDGGARAGTMTSSFTATSITAFGGTTMGAQNGDAAGQALALQQGSVSNGVAANNGANLTFGTSTVGFASIIVSLAIQRTGTGFDTDQFQYSLDGTTYTNFGTAFTPAASFALQTFDLSGVAGLANNALASFRIVFSSSASVSPSNAGNNRLDNIAINGTAITTPPVTTVPEPASMALLGLGLLGVAAAPRARRGR